MQDILIQIWMLHYYVCFSFMGCVCVCVYIYHTIFYSWFFFFGQPLGTLHCSRCVSKDCQFQKHLFVNPNTLSLIVIYLQFDVLPWGLEGVLKYIKQNYGNLPVYILENGINLSLSLVPYLVSKHYKTLASTPRGLVGWVSARRILRVIKKQTKNITKYWEFLCKYTLGQPTNQHSSLNDVGRVDYLHAYIAAVLNSVRCAL